MRPRGKNVVEITDALHKQANERARNAPFLILRGGGEGVVKNGKDFFFFVVRRLNK